MNVLKQRNSQTAVLLMESSHNPLKCTAENNLKPLSSNEKGPQCFRRSKRPIK